MPNQWAFHSAVHNIGKDFHKQYIRTELAIEELERNDSKVYISHLADKAYLESW